MKLHLCSLRYLLLIAFLALFSGCADLTPGADPLVVRTEQALTGADSTLNLALKLDNADRGFWRTNAPGFHNFCEWLRQPQTIADGSTEPRGAALVLNVNQVKRDYKTGKATGSDLEAALAALNSAVSQAASWNNVVALKAPANQ